jgi:hypothetical protein
MTGVRFRGFRVTYLCSNCYSLFYSHSPLHDSVVRPSSRANIYLKKYHGWREVHGFPSNGTPFQKFFTTLSLFSAIWYGRMTIFRGKICTSRNIITGVRFRGFRLTNYVSIVVHYFIPIPRYIFRSYDHLHLEIYTSQIIMTGVRFRAFRLTQLCFISCLLFYSNYPLQVSVIRPSSFRNI